MSIIIKGMDMPDNCEKCRFFVDKWCYADSQMRGNNFSERPHWCPIEEQRWIPVTERLPEELEEVNITWININPAPYYKGKPFTGSAVYYKGMWFWYSANCVDYLRECGFSPYDGMDDATKVLAWKPMPEPWKGDAK